MLKFENPTHFRQIIVCSVLSERPVLISNIRVSEINSGLAEYEVNFLKLVEKITNGSKIQIDESGQQVKFYPGVITNNDEHPFEFDCGNMRAISYYLEPLMVLSMFGKVPLVCSLIGITNDPLDISTETVVNCTVKLFKYFGVHENIFVKVTRRGFRTSGGGEIKIRIPTIKQLSAAQILDEGLVKRIRGTACGVKINPQILNRIISSAREILNDYIPDVWIYSDLGKAPKKDDASGYHVTLIAETNKDCFISAEDGYEQNATEDNNLPEKVGERAAMKLLDELLYSGVVDTTHQWLVFLMMAIAERKVSTIKVGRVSDYTIGYLRNLKKFFGTKFQIKKTESKIEPTIPEGEEENEEDEIDLNQKEFDIPQNLIFSCMGIGLTNFSRKVT